MFDFTFLYFFVCCVLLFCSFCHIVLHIIATNSFIIILLKYYDKGICSNNIQLNMTECTKQQHTTNKEIKKYKISCDGLCPG